MKIMLLIAFLFLPLSAFADLPTINFSHQKYAYQEGEVAIVTVELSSPTLHGVTALLDIGQSTAGGYDLDIDTVPHIYIGPGETRGSISFRIYDDGDREDLEFARFRLSSAINARIGTRNVIEIEISDREEIGLPNVNFEVATSTALETQVIEVKATLSSSTSSMVVVPISVCGSAEYPSDHNLYINEIVFNPGVTEATISIFIYGDQIEEETEDIVIKMISPVSNAVLGEIKEHTVSIQNFNKKLAIH